MKKLLLLLVLSCSAFAGDDPIYFSQYGAKVLTTKKCILKTVQITSVTGTAAVFIYDAANTTTAMTATNLKWSMSFTGTTSEPVNLNYNFFNGLVVDVGSVTVTATVGLANPNYVPNQVIR